MVRLLSAPLENIRILDLRRVLAGPWAAQLLGDGRYRIARRARTYQMNSEGQSVPQVSNPVEFGATPVRYERAPPLPGEHPNEVLREWLGYSDAEIGTLRESEVI